VKHRVEAKLAGKVTKKLLEVVLRHSPNAVCVLAEDGRFCYANDAAISALGYEQADMAGLNFFERVHPDDMSRLKDRLERAEDGEYASASVIIRVLKGGDRWTTMEAFVTREGDEADSPLLLVYLSDTSRRLETEGRLKKLSSAVEHIDESVVITNRNGVVEYVNNAFERTTGYTKEEVIGKTPAILKSGKHDQAFYKWMWDTILAGESFHGTVINKRKDGTLYYEQKTISPLIDADGIVTHHVATGMDVTHNKLAEERLRAGVERYALSVRGANDGLWDWDFRTGHLHLSERWKTMLGLSRDELGNTIDDWFRLVHPDDLAELKTLMKAHIEGTTSHFEHEHRMRHKDGGYCWVLTRGLVVRDSDAKAYRMAGSQTDITDRKMAEEQLQHDALHDALTGLPNRTLFMDRLGLAIARAKRSETCHFAVMFMDLDRFKIINDSLGHLAGDQLLIELANRVKGCLRASDTVARLGGDEFAMLLENTQSDKEITLFAERVQTCIAEPFRIGSRDVFTSASIGIAQYDDAYSRPDDMVRDADTAMYHAKNHGKAHYTVFSPSMRSRALQILDLETGLRRAIESQQLTVHYQPIVSLKSGRIFGFEALSRWPHPERGFISPEEFIPLAEETGLINTIGLLVLRKACLYLKSIQGRFRTHPPLTMSVNLSGIQFMRPELLGQVDLMLREYGLDPRTLKLEITESVIIDHAEYAREMIDQMKAQNIRLSIDDFGTGYSSLRSLRQYPIDTVKIDQSFVATMCENEESLEIVRTTVSMAHKLRMEVIAEGVEAKKQMDLLASMDCDFGQGFYFARPMEQDAADAILARQSHWWQGEAIDAEA